MAAQVRLFADASVAVGIHGAGLTNLMWCRPGAVAVEVGQVAHDCYRPLAGALRLRYVAQPSVEFSATHASVLAALPGFCRVAHGVAAQLASGRTRR